MGKQAAEVGYKRCARTCCLLSPHRKGTLFGPSGVWEVFIGQDVRNLGIGPEIGLLYDDLFLALTHSSPSAQWYTQLLAVRDTLFSHWANNPRTHTRHGTLIVVLLCNALAIMDLQ